VTSAEAKRILEVCRPRDINSEDGEIRAAVEVMRRDPQLQSWFEQHSRVENVIRASFRSIEPPAQLKQRLLAQNKIVRPQFTWGIAQWVQLAACLAIVVAGLGFLAQHLFRARDDQFAQFESRMVRSALREYKMEVLTKDMGQLRQWMQQRSAPADFVVPKGLSQLALTGGGVLHWQNHPVSMACFDRGDKQMVFLFVMDKSAVADPPPSLPQSEQVKKLATIAWTEGDKTYLLASPGKQEALRKYL
jgi:hypothetical protein